MTGLSIIKFFRYPNIIIIILKPYKVIFGKPLILGAIKYWLSFKIRYVKTITHNTCETLWTLFNRGGLPSTVKFQFPSLLDSLANYEWRWINSWSAIVSKFCNYVLKCYVNVKYWWSEKACSVNYFYRNSIIYHLFIK